MCPARRTNGSQRVPTAPWQADPCALNPFTTGNPFLGTQLLGFSIGRGSGALEGLTTERSHS